VSDTGDNALLEALLDSWDRNNRILVGLLRVIPPEGFGARSAEGSPTVAQLFMHMHYVRLAFVEEDTPEFAVPVSTEEWLDERDPARIEAMLNESTRIVRDAAKARIVSGKPMDMHYDHPILFLQHMIWHEGYHHGQIKIALKRVGTPVPDSVAGPATWGVWMRKS
jgi:uncharacterized damage-inducible protein DinB